MANLNKKALSPVVATALLLVVAVVAIAGFQTWYTSFSSNQYAEIEKQSNVGASINVELLQADTLFLKADIGKNITKITIADEVCETSLGKIDKTITEYNLSAVCGTFTAGDLKVGETVDIVVFTTEGIQPLTANVK